MTKVLLDFFQWINNTITGNFGLTIVLFTILLRILSLPFDYRARKGQRDFAKKNAMIQPELERLQKAYKDKPDVLQRKMMELRRSVGLGLMPKGCFSQLLVYPLFIAFFTVFRNMAAIQIANLANSANPDAWMSENAFLWVKNIWMPDNAVTLSNIPVLKDSLLGGLFRGIHADIIPTGEYLATILQSLPESFGGNKEAITASINNLAQQYTGNNGLFILPILAGVVQFLSFKVSQKLSPTTSADPSQPAQGQGFMKFMNIFFPILFVYFCLTSSSALSIYWITSSLVMLLTNFLINMYLVSKEKKEEALIAQGIQPMVKQKEGFGQKFMSKLMAKAEESEKLIEERRKNNKK